MAVGLLVIWLFGSLAFLSLLIWLVYLLKHQPEDDKPYPLIFNFMSHYTNGRAVGVERKVSRTIEGDLICEFEPRDIDVDKIKGKISRERIIVDKSKRIVIAKGNMSQEREVGFYFPRKPNDLPEDLINHPFGALIQTWISLDNAKKDEVDGLLEYMKRARKHILDIGGGELSEERVKTAISLYEEIIKSVNAIRKDKENVLPPRPYGNQ